LEVEYQIHNKPYSKSQSGLNIGQHVYSELELDGQHSKSEINVNDNSQIIDQSQSHSELQLLEEPQYDIPEQFIPLCRCHTQPRHRKSFRSKDQRTKIISQWNADKEQEYEREHSFSQYDILPKTKRGMVIHQLFDEDEQENQKSYLLNGEISSSSRNENVDNKIYVKKLKDDVINQHHKKQVNSNVIQGGKKEKLIQEDRFLFSPEPISYQVKNDHVSHVKENELSTKHTVTSDASRISSKHSDLIETSKINSDDNNNYNELEEGSEIINRDNLENISKVSSNRDELEEYSRISIHSNLGNISKISGKRVELGDDSRISIHSNLGNISKISNKPTILKEEISEKEFSEEESNEVELSDSDNDNLEGNVEEGSRSSNHGILGSLLKFINKRNDIEDNSNNNVQSDLENISNNSDEQSDINEDSEINAQNLSGNVSKIRNEHSKLELEGQSRISSHNSKENSSNISKHNINDELSTVNNKSLTVGENVTIKHLLSDPEINVESDDESKKEDAKYHLFKNPTKIFDTETYEASGSESRKRKRYEDESEEESENESPKRHLSDRIHDIRNSISLHDTVTPVTNAVKNTLNLVKTQFLSPYSIIEKCPIEFYKKFVDDGPTLNETLWNSNQSRYKLLIIVGNQCQSMRVYEVPLSWKSLSSHAAYVLDYGGETFIQFIGSKCTAAERLYSANICNKLKKRDYYGRGTICHFEEEEALSSESFILDLFWEALGLAETTSEYKRSRIEKNNKKLESAIVQERENPSIETLINVYIVNVENQCLDLIHEGSMPNNKLLDSKSVIIVDAFSEVYLWKGSKSSLEARNLGVELAKQLYINHPIYIRPSWAVLEKINESFEPVLFAEKFKDRYIWDDVLAEPATF